MKSLDLSQATAPLHEYARDLNDNTLLLTDGGQPVAALVPIDPEDVESLALGTNPKFVAILESARRQRAAGYGLTAAEVRNELGLK